MQNIFDQNRLLLISHRGGAGLFPENTIYGFWKSIQQFSADVLELDIHLTKDGEIVVIHDEAVDRTTNGSGLVRELLLKDIKKLDAGWSFTLDGGKTYPFRGVGLTIPTLKEVFEEFKDVWVGLNVEIKRVYGYLENKLYNMIIGFDLMNRVMVTSSSPAISKRFDNINKRGIYTGGDAFEGVKALTLLKMGLGSLYKPKNNALQLPLVFRNYIKVVSKEMVALCKQKGVKIHVWTINDVENMQKLVDMGVDGIITDYPDRLSAVLQTRQGDRFLVWSQK